MSRHRGRQFHVRALRISSSDNARGTTMGEVIQGPWKRREGPDLREQLEIELHKLQKLLAEVREEPAEKSGAHAGGTSIPPRQEAVKLDSV